RLGELVCFFQGEEGMRALAVTGVQRCALPSSSQASRGKVDLQALRDLLAKLVQAVADRCIENRVTHSEHDPAKDRGIYVAGELRSEERRVGEERREELSVGRSKANGDKSRRDA